MLAMSGISLDAMPTPGALMGSIGRKSLIDQINMSLGTSGFFGGVNDMFSQYRDTFFSNIIAPMARVSEAAHNVITRIMNPDCIRPIVTEADLYSIPQSMYIPIMTYQPMRDMLVKGNIYGFGIDPAHLPEEDAYHRLDNNYTCDDVLSACDENGMVEFVGEFYSDDPEVSFDELRAIRQTRHFMEMMMKKHIDPTDYPNECG